MLGPKLYNPITTVTFDRSPQRAIQSKHTIPAASPRQLA